MRPEIITQDLINVPAGGYSVTVTDFNGCTTAANYTLTQPSSAAVITYNTYPVFCFGDSTGWANATVIGGALPYSFAWSNGFNTEDIFNVPAGVYTLTVTDNTNCVTTAAVSITQPQAPIFASANITNVSCFGLNNANIVTSISGGSPSYLTQWANGSTLNFLNNLSIGNYAFHVEDSLGCVLDTVFTVTQPVVLSFNTALTNVACFGGSTAVIDITPTGGTAPFFYDWSTGATTQDVQNLPVGAYNVIVTDINGCIDSAVYNIIQPLTPIALTIASNTIGCFNANTGSIDLGVVGGTPAYTYLWSNAATTQDLQNLSAGIYALTLSDALGCTDTISVVITQPIAPLALNASINNVTCFGQNNGAIDITTTGGTPAYNFLWSNAATTEDLQNISGGQYTITAADVNGCLASLIVNVSAPNSAIAATPSQTPVSCFGYNNGIMSVVVGGGSAPYDYLWSNGQTTPTINGLTAGLYTLTITDDNGCQLILNQVLNQPDSLIAAFAIDDNAGCAPFAVEFINNSIGSYSNSTWNMNNGDVFNNLDTLNYTFLNQGCNDITLTITSANGCIATTTLNSAVCVSTGPVANFYSMPSEIDFYTGEIQFINSSLGNDNTYFWNFGDGSQQANVINPSHIYPQQVVANYQVMLVAVDSNGCSDTTYQNFNLNEMIVLNVPNAFSINQDGINETFKPVFSDPDLVKTYNFTIYNRWGEIIFQTNDVNDAWDGTYKGKNVPIGAYNWTVYFSDFKNKSKGASGHVVVLR